MSAVTVSAFELNTVALDNAVFCVNCEMISNSQHDVCDVCGSRSLVALCRVLGGTIRKRPLPVRLPPPPMPKSMKYHLELSIDAHDVCARDLNRAIEVASQLSEAGGVIEHLHINVESVRDEEDSTSELRAA
jgi:hypothetical protein